MLVYNISILPFVLGPVGVAVSLISWSTIMDLDFKAAPIKNDWTIEIKKMLAKIDTVGLFFFIVKIVMRLE